jgi:SAM-dependent methyltransferase
MNHIYTPMRACPVCDGRRGNVLGRLNYALFDDLDISGTKTMLSCAACGMIFDDVSFTEEQLKEYYRHNEHYAASSLGGSGSLSDDNQQRYDKIIDLLHPAPNEIILDVGCGQGGFVAKCLQRGFRAAGIEPSEKSRNAALSAGLNIYSSMGEYAAKNHDERIGTVVLSHVLEHLMNPLQVLQKLVSNVQGATVYMEVPDAASYISPNKMHWHELYFEHLNHFCNESLLNFAACSGVDVIRVGSAPFSETLADIQCLFLVGRLRCAADNIVKAALTVTPPEFTLPPLPGADLPRDNRPVALWGVSQYAMLLMGSLQQLERVDRLFDASSAKIGRKIRGVTIEDANAIRTLSKDTILILPYSQYSQQMRAELDESASFLGKIVNIQGSQE